MNINKVHPQFQKHILITSLVPAIILSALTISFTARDMPYFSTDSYYYIEMAEGRTYNVIRPFINRFFYPMIVRTTSHITGLSIDHIFALMGFLALISFTWSICLIHRQFGIPGITSILIIFSPLLLDLYKDYYLPDLFFNALLALFFLMLLRTETKPWYKWPSLILLFLLCLTRAKHNCISFDSCCR